MPRRAVAIPDTAEICNECGRSVAPGSGRFVNRIPDLNDEKTREEMGKPFPEGDYICEECDRKLREAETPPSKMKLYDFYYDDGKTGLCTKDKC